MIRNRFGPPKTKPGKRRSFTRQELKAVTHLTRLGATTAQIALFFEVHQDTVTNWQHQNARFKNAQKRGGLYSDMRVANSLYKRAVGFEYIEEEYTAIEIDGKPLPLSKMCQVKRVKKVMPPDVKAIIHYLRIKQRDFWTVVPEMLHNVNHTGKVNHLHQKIQDIPVQELSGDAQKLLFEITQKQLQVNNN